jgi:predicted transposase YbfD/YdcC
VGHSILIAIDGKTVRGTIGTAHPRGEHLLCAYLPAEGIVLCQVAVGSKENEITAAPTLLATLDLRGKIVMGDALHPQRALSVQIQEAGGDYIWIAKDNQPTLHADIATLLALPEPTVLGGYVPTDFQTARTVDKGHGRRETRQITVCSDLNAYLDWPQVAQVFRLDRDRVELKTGKTTHETIYGLTSLTRETASARSLLGQIRSHWGIENGLHHRRDVTFHEDRTRLTRGHAGQVMAILNNLVIGLLRRRGATNLAQARPDYRADLPSAVHLLVTSARRL